MGNLAIINSKQIKWGILIIPTKKRELLIDLTMKIESIREIDFIVYTKSSWERNLMDTASFASLIQKTGVKIYG